jgi:hypothetical protein
MSVLLALAGGGAALFSLIQLGNAHAAYPDSGCGSAPDLTIPWGAYVGAISACVLAIIIGGVARSEAKQHPRAVGSLADLGVISILISSLSIVALVCGGVVFNFLLYSCLRG